MNRVKPVLDGLQTGIVPMAINYYLMACQSQHLPCLRCKWPLHCKSHLLPKNNFNAL